MSLLLPLALLIGGAGLTFHRPSPDVPDHVARPARVFELVSTGAVVSATPPSLSEVVDLILGENPAAGGPDRSGADPEVGKISGILRRHTADKWRAERIATALVDEGRRAHIGSMLLVGVLLTENPQLDPYATSFVGARGLMQVMPFHKGRWGCTSSDLFQIEANICHGVRILADNIKRSRTLSGALLGYNGCVRGTNTPNCHTYPNVVYRHARKSAEAGEVKVGGFVPFSFAAAPRPQTRGTAD